jgi:hypothetical protein
MRQRWILDSTSIRSCSLLWPISPQARTTFAMLFCAAAAIDALAAHIYWWCSQNAALHVAGLAGDDAYRGHLRASNRDFELTSDVAKANKHVVLVRGQPTVQSAATATMVKAPGWDEFRWDDFTWDSPPVALLCPTGDAPWNALGVLERALSSSNRRWPPLAFRRSSGG